VSRRLGKSAFDCGNAILNDYFRFYAFKNDQLSIGKTFVALNDEQVVAGFMTLASAQLEAEALPAEIRSRLPRYPVPAFRIAKLAVATVFQGRGVGAWLLRSALERAIAVSASVGTYSVIVDAIDDKAKSFYQKYGFISLAGHGQTLFLPLASISKAVLLESSLD